MTEYVILRAQEENPDGWDRVDGTIRASSPAAAIRTLPHTGKNTYAAVPARSWHPLTVKVESTVKVTIG